MESGRLDLESAAEVNGTNGSVATYKSVTDDDNNWQGNKKDEKIIVEIMVKKDSELEIQDGATEKMLNEETSINSNKSPTEVNFNK